MLILGSETWQDLFECKIFFFYSDARLGYINHTIFNKKIVIMK